MDYFKAHNKRQWTHRIYMAYHFPLYIFKQMGLISDEAFRKPWPAHLGWYVRGYSLEEADQVWNWVAETQVSKNFSEKSSKNQMPSCVLNSANILIYRHPAFNFFSIKTDKKTRQSDTFW